MACLHENPPHNVTVIITSRRQSYWYETDGRLRHEPCRKKAAGQKAHEYPQQRNSRTRWAVRSPCGKRENASRVEQNRSGCNQSMRLPPPSPPPYNKACRKQTVAASVVGKCLQCGGRVQCPPPACRVCKVRVRSGKRVMWRRIREARRSALPR